MPATHSTSAGTGRSILLVEEYGALAVAIGSALKKFAPLHQTRVVPTLAAAEEIVTELRPELLVVDIDPPQVGAIDFFARMKFALPDAGVLIIAAGTSRNVLAARERPVAFEFIEKPFDLAELGRAIETLLTLGDGADLRLVAFGLTDLLPLLCASSATAVLTVEAAGNRRGEIHLGSGQIVHAVAAGRVGVEALREMLIWPAPRLAEADQEQETARTITRGWQPLLLEAFSRPKPPLRSRGRTQEENSSRGGSGEGKKLVVVDDTELLRIFVEDILATAAPELEIVTAANGFDGLKQIAATRPDAVLLDYSLPDITGDEVCRRLLEDENTAGMPVIMMSGHVQEMVATSARYRNVVATIAKPFLSGALVQLVRTTLAAASGLRKTAVRPDAVGPTAQEKVSDVVLAPAVEISAPAVRERNGRHEKRSVADVASPLAQTADPQPRTLRPSQTSAAPVEVWQQAHETIPDAPVAPREPAVESPAPQPSLRATPPIKSSAPQSLPPPAIVAASTVIENWQPNLSESAVSRLTIEPTAFAPPPLALLAVPAANQNIVMLGLPLEVLSMQFSPALRMAAIRARPCSGMVSLHLQPHSAAGVALPAAGFDLGHVDLNTRGHVETLRLIPREMSMVKPPPRDRFRVNGVAILPSRGGRAMELTPASAAPMTIELFASFEVAAVELSPTFGLVAIVLKSRGAAIRVTLQSGGPATGATFKTAQILLDREGRIAEVLLDSMV